MMERRRALDGPLPRRVVARQARRSTLPRRRAVRRSSTAARASRRCRPRWRSPACCATCCRDDEFGAAGRADHPRRGPHVRHGRPVPGVQDLRRRRASSTSRSTPSCCCPTPRPRTARSSRRASPRPARWRSFTAAGTSYATRGVPMVPFFIFYSMFGFQRVGDLIWAGGRRPRAAASCSAPPPAAPRCSARACSTRTATASCWRRPCPSCEAYDPAFAYELAAIIQRRHRAHVLGDDASDVFYYLTLYNENYVDAADARAAIDDGIIAGLYRWADGARRAERTGPRSCSRARRRARPARPQAELAEHYDVGAELWSATSYKRAPRGGARRPSAGTGCTRPRRRARRYVTERAARRRRARSSPSPTT